MFVLKLHLLLHEWLELHHHILCLDPEVGWKQAATWQWPKYDYHQVLLLRPQEPLASVFLKIGSLSTSRLLGTILSSMTLLEGPTGLRRANILMITINYSEWTRYNQQRDKAHKVGSQRNHVWVSMDEWPSRKVHRPCLIFPRMVCNDMWSVTDQKSTL